MKTVRFLFSDDMARAIVEGRKTVMRRPVMPQPEEEHVDQIAGDTFRMLRWRGSWATASYVAKTVASPGDILIGRECWADVDGVAVYRADGARTLADWRSEYGKRCAFHGCKYCEDCFAPYMWESKPSVETWRHSIHMPDWAARIRRRVVSVTVERLLDITEEDARREGVEMDDDGEWIGGHHKSGGIIICESARDAFWSLWNGIYSANGIGWRTNPWVWRIEFASENVQEVSDGR